MTEETTTPTQDDNVTHIGDAAKKDEELSLTAEETQNINALRQRANEIVNEIGQMELRKARLFGHMAETEAQVQRVLNGAGERLGIGDRTWQVQPDGKIVFPPTPPEGAAPPPGAPKPPQ